MPKSKQFNNRLDIEDFPDVLTKEDWIDLYKSLMAWGKRAAKRNKLQQSNEPDRATQKLELSEGYKQADIEAQDQVSRE